MKILKGIIILILLLFLLSMVIITPMAWLGVIIFIIGLVLINQKNKGNVIISRPVWLLPIGIIVAFIMGMVFVEPTEIAEEKEEIEVEEVSKQNSEQVDNDKADEENAEAEEKAKAEREAQAKAEEEAQAKAEQEAKAKAEQEAKAKAEEEAQAKAEEEAQASISKTESFQNCTEMRKVYPNGVSSDHPAYASKHDRDKDNYACER